MPGYVEQADALKAAGVDEIWCVSVNDPFVMGAWARDQKTAGKVRMMADGSADFAKATGLTFDLTSRGMGVRSQRYSMLVKDGVVKTLNIEAPGKFEVSDAKTLVEQAKASEGLRSAAGLTRASPAVAIIVGFALCRASERASNSHPTRAQD